MKLIPIPICVCCDSARAEWESDRWPTVNLCYGCARELAQFIDHALLNNLSPVTVIHGKGTGALRKGTWEYLRSNPRVKSFAYAAPNAGGDGATIVYLQ